MEEDLMKFLSERGVNEKMIDNMKEDKVQAILC